MRPRQDIIELFASFLQVETVSSQTWVMDTRLRRNMRSCLNQATQATAEKGAQAATPELVVGAMNLSMGAQPTTTNSYPASAPPASPPELSESFWCSYWYRQWAGQAQAASDGGGHSKDHGKDRAKDVLAIAHLSAYLQEPCYWAVNRIFKRFQSDHYSFADGFQLALTTTSVVLRRFQVDRGASLRTYAEMAFVSALRDLLRQRHEVDLCTDWQLLRKTGKKPLTDALQTAGLSIDAIAQYRLAWTCFNRIYVPDAKSHKLPIPNARFWASVAQLYYQERLNQLGASQAGAVVSPQAIEQWLMRAAQWIRQYRYPAVASLNLAKSEQNANELQDDLPDTAKDSLLTELIEQEEWQARQAQQAEVYAVLQQAIAALDPDSQKILRLYYQEQQTQQQITQQTGLNQSTISRRLKNAKKSLLKTLAEWTQNTLHISLSPDLIESMSVAVEEWFYAYYTSSNPS